MSQRAGLLVHFDVVIEIGEQRAGDASASRDLAEMPMARSLGRGAHCPEQPAITDKAPVWRAESDGQSRCKFRRYCSLQCGDRSGRRLALITDAAKMLTLTPGGWRSTLTVSNVRPMLSQSEGPMTRSSPKLNIWRPATKSIQPSVELPSCAYASRISQMFW